jgi:hypothetical protein
MSDINRAEVDTLLKDIAKMQKEIAELQRANRLVGNIPQGQSIIVVDPADNSYVARIGLMEDEVSVGSEFYDPAGNVIARIGQISGGNNGMEIGDSPSGFSTDTWLYASEAGLALPYITHSTYKADDFYTVTSGTFTAGYRYWMELLSYQRVKFPNCVVQTAVGTTAEFRIHCLTTGNSTSAVAVGSGATVNQTFVWDVSAFLNVGFGPFVFELQARRTGGAGNVFIYAPPACTSGNIPGATGTGV